MAALSAALGAIKYVPASVGIKMLEKVSPKFKNYFTQAAAYGYDANNALDYLASKFESEGTKQFKGQLAQGEAQGTLRPDEQVAKKQIETSEIPGKIARSAVAFGGAALSGLPGAAAQTALAINQPSKSQALPEVEMGPFQGQMGPQEQGPEQGQMGPFRQGKEKPTLKQNLMQNLTPMQKASGVIPKTQGEAVKQYNEMQKRKKEYMKLHEEFGDYYGGQQQQGQPGQSGNLAKLIQLLQQRQQGKM